MKVSLQKKFNKIDKDLVECFVDVLKEHPHKILYDKDKDYLTYQITVEKEIPYEIDVFEKSMSLPMKEITTSNLLETFTILSYSLYTSGLFITNIVCGDRKTFFKNLHKKFTEPQDYFLGARITDNGELPSDIALFIISDKKNAEVIDFKLAIKVVNE